MGVASPELMAQAFADRFNAKDIKGFCELYAEGAVFTYDGVEKAVGRAQIESALAGFMMVGLHFRGECVGVLIYGDTALTRFKWEMLDAQGGAVSSGVSAEVQRRGPDGLWRLIIDDTGGGNRR
jgi:ketosteroid isomerase-like protein